MLIIPEGNARNLCHFRIKPMMNEILLSQVARLTLIDELEESWDVYNSIKRVLFRKTARFVTLFVRGFYWYYKFLFSITQTYNYIKNRLLLKFVSVTTVIHG